jgi:hypothetical protein
MENTELQLAQNCPGHPVMQIIAVQLPGTTVPAYANYTGKRPVF